MLHGPGGFNFYFSFRHIIGNFKRTGGTMMLKIEAKWLEGEEEVRNIRTIR